MRVRAATPLATSNNSSRLACIALAAHLLAIAITLGSVAVLTTLVALVLRYVA